MSHVQRIQAADLSVPIILSADGHIMDGMHRVAKAWLLGHTEIHAVQFAEDPEPDQILEITPGTLRGSGLVTDDHTGSEVDSLGRHTAYDAHADDLHVLAIRT